MSVLIDNYNKLYPAFAAKPINSNCVIAEQEAEDAQHTFRTLKIKGVSGWMFPHDLPKQATSFYDKSQNGLSDSQKELPSYNILRKDCDGIFCIEENNKIVIYVCELKSSYTIDAINKAKDQIVGSFLKLLGQLSLLQDYDKDNIEMRGIIVAYEATTERLADAKKLADRKARFFLQLNELHQYIMPQNKCEQYWHPLRCPEITIKYLEIPLRQKCHEIDFSQIK